ncbi:MAG: redoxin domain-containing protein [Chlorobia bacterium]|nr:redoxin domain-containing protein [Fimbriimonadaceae bacterium]
MTIAAIAILAIGAPSPLGIGDRAPALQFDEIKGSPVRSFSKSKATVVEFWATWCKPCIEGMPHLSELWSRYKDRVDFVGVSVMENDLSAVRPFVKSMGDKLAYPVAVDKLDKAGKGFMYKNWLEAAGQKGIPVAFIVDKQAKIAWIGHPTKMERVLDQVVEGTWDARAFRTAFEKQANDDATSDRLVNEAYGRIGSVPRQRSYADALKWIADNRSKYNSPSAQGALNELQSLFDAFDKGDYEKALKQSGTEPSNPVVWSYFRPMFLVAKIDALQVLKSDWRAATRIVIEGPPDPNALMALVDALTLPDSKLAEKDPEIAFKAAEKLAGLARDPMFLVRLAWAHYRKGEVEKAKAVVEEAFGKIEEQKKRNPQSVDSMIRRLHEAKAYFSLKL